MDHGLQIGQVIKNDDLKSIFGCGLMGGMRRSHRTNTLIIVSDHTRGLYEDRWDGEILYYTGMGQIGDQSLSFAQNKTLVNSRSNGIEVYLFEVFHSTNYVFRGEVELIADPFQENQLDAKGNLRKVWLFPMKLKDQIAVAGIDLSREMIESVHERKGRHARSLNLEELKKRAETGTRAGKRTVSTSTYERDEYVSEYAKRRADGVCQLCEQSAPFVDKHGNPYLETHHIIWLARGGADTVENTVALCPNCHRKMHSLGLTEDVEKLKRKALLHRN